MVIQGTLKHDLLVLLGDWNAKIGAKSIGHTFKPPYILVDNKPTATPSEEVNQIDQLAINSKLNILLQDVRTYRGSDVGSDHRLVIAKIKLRLHKTGKQEIKPEGLNQVK